MTNPQYRFNRTLLRSAVGSTRGAPIGSWLGKLSRIVPILFLAATAPAQQLPPGEPTAATSPGKGEIVELNPFVITADSDRGYDSNEALTGTRLRAQTKNIASAQTIVTADFMQDIGALNFYDIADFMPSTSTYTINEGDTNGNGPRTGTPFYVRGYRSDSLTTNFFTSATPVDTYNISRISFTRGPNSILFGGGSAGGGVDVPTNRAQTDRARGSLSFAGDSFGSRRVALDSNLVLRPGNLAVRFDLLTEDRRTYLDPTWAKRDSIYGTVTWQPTKNTTVYLNAEKTALRQKIGRSYGIYDWYNTWAGAGKPLVATAKRTAALNGVEFFSGNGYVTYVPGVGAADWGAMSYGARPLILNARTASYGYGAGSPNPIVPLNTNLLGDSDRVRYFTNNASLVVQQRLARNLYLELGYQHEHTYRTNLEPGDEAAIRVDTNAQLPNGTPNPNAGRPYIEMTPSEQSIPTDINQFRATVSYEQDLRRLKLFGRGLGTFTVAGMYANHALHQFLDAYSEVNTTPLTVAAAGLNDARNRVHRRTYIVPGQVETFTTDWAPIAENGIRSGWVALGTPRNNITRNGTLMLASQALLLDELLAFTAGLRRDEVMQTQRDYVRDALGVFPSSHTSAGTTAVEQIGRTSVVGAVLNLHRTFALFANKSTNFRASNQGSRYVDNSLFPAITGDGYDLGVKFFLLDQRVTGSINYFETNQRNISDGTIAGRKRAWIDTIWQAVDNTRNPGTSWGDTKAQQTSGVEFQVVANPSRQLRLTANFSRNRSELLDHGAVAFAYIDSQTPVWLAKANTPVTSADGKTVGELVARVQQEVSDDQHVIGIGQTQTYVKQANFVGRYEFARGTPLSGFAVGTTFRWRSAPIIGFARVTWPAGILDTTRPFYGAATTNADTWLEYNRDLKLAGRKLRWSAQLRAQNLWDDRTMQPWTASDDGTGHALIQRRLMPRARQLVASSTFSF